MPKFCHYQFWHNLCNLHPPIFEECNFAEWELAFLNLKQIIAVQFQKTILQKFNIEYHQILEILYIIEHYFRFLMIFMENSLPIDSHCARSQEFNFKSEKCLTSSLMLETLMVKTLETWKRHN